MSPTPSTATRRRIGYDPPCLIGGCCRDCRHEMWPRRAVCARCGGRDVVEHALGAEASVVTWTNVWTPLADLEVPYVLGLADMGKVRIFAHLRGDLAQLRPGARVRLAADAGAHPTFWFEV